MRIINRLNDNYDHFYVKRTDASRVYGLELEELLSPNTVTFLVHGDTLVEEHIIGIPGDDYMRDHLAGPVFNQIRLAKEFVKFNERCFVRLLGDMRSYNFVVAVTPDIEGSQFRLRAIDFDQQSYEGRKNFYLPQYFRENNPIIFLGIEHMEPETVKQYQLEERSLIAARARAEQGPPERAAGDHADRTARRSGEGGQLAHGAGRPPRERHLPRLPHHGRDRRGEHQPGAAQGVQAEHRRGLGQG